MRFPVSGELTPPNYISFAAGRRRLHPSVLEISVRHLSAKDVRSSLSLVAEMMANCHTDSQTGMVQVNDDDVLQIAEKLLRPLLTFVDTVDRRLESAGQMLSCLLSVLRLMTQHIHVKVSAAVCFAFT